MEIPPHRNKIVVSHSKTIIETCEVQASPVSLDPTPRSKSKDQSRRVPHRPALALTVSCGERKRERERERDQHLQGLRSNGYGSKWYQTKNHHFEW